MEIAEFDDKIDLEATIDLVAAKTKAEKHSQIIEEEKQDAEIIDEIVGYSSSKVLVKDPDNSADDHANLD